MIIVTSPEYATCKMYEESRATCCDTLGFIDAYKDCNEHEIAEAHVFLCDITIIIYSAINGKFLRKRNYEFFHFVHE